MNNTPCECLCMWFRNNPGRVGSSKLRRLEAYSREWSRRKKSDQIRESYSFPRAILALAETARDLLRPDFSINSAPKN